MTTERDDARATVADLYVRLSLDRDGATSLVRQEADCRRWCSANGLEVRRVHTDRGISGFDARARRNGFESALAALADGNAGTLAGLRLQTAP